MRVVVAAIAAGIAAAVCITAQTATLDTLEVARKRGRYELYADTYLAAPPADIFEVLLEYEDDKFQRISSVYKESRYLDPAADGTARVFTRMEGCIMFYCMQMRRTERLEAEEFKYIRTMTIPEESDFKYSHSEWTFAPEHDGTRMTYSLVMEPDFFVPPIVGPFILKRVLRSGGARVISRIERMAQGQEMPRRGARRR
jgi:hypothetical protein